MMTKPFFNIDPSNITDKINAFKTDILYAHDESFLYSLLSRMQGDCDYYLGYGGRCDKHLWGTTAELHMIYMELIWNHFALDKKPEWLTKEELDEYKRRMLSPNDAK